MRNAKPKRDPSLPPKAITTYDRDTIETVGVFKKHRDYATWSQAMEKLIQKAKERGLHLETADQLATH